MKTQRSYQTLELKVVDFILTVTNGEKMALVGIDHRGLKHLFLEQTEGYVKALKKSTSLPSTTREVFEHCVQKD